MKKLVRMMAAAALGLTAWQAAPAVAAPLFNPVVTVVGDGKITLSGGVGVTTSVYLYNNSVASQASPLSSASYNSGVTGTRLINSGSASSEGSLTNNPGVANAAAQGKVYAGTPYVYNAGYDKPNNTASVIGTAANANRSLGQMTVGSSTVSGATVLQTQTQVTAYNNNNLRGATGDDTGTKIYSAGTASTAALGGWRNFSTNTILTSTPTNVRTVELLGNSLFGSTGSGGTVGIFAIDPTGVNPATPFITTGSSSNHSPYEFALFNDTSNPNSTLGYNVAYIADDGGAATAAGGIEKWTYNGTTWSQAYILSDAGAFYRGLAGQKDPTTGAFTLYATTSDGLKLQQVTDTGANSTFTTLASFVAADNLFFRGVALAPAAVPEPGTFALAGLGLCALVAIRRRVKR